MSFQLMESTKYGVATAYGSIASCLPPVITSPLSTTASTAALATAVTCGSLWSRFEPPKRPTFAAEHQQGVEWFWQNVALPSIGLASGAAVARRFFSKIKTPHRQFRWAVYRMGATNHVRAGKPFATDVVLRRQGYAVGYNVSLRQPEWASYFVTARSLYVQQARSGNCRSENFIADPDLPPSHAVRLEEMSGTGYDRGHLAPRASVAFSDESARESFYLSNVVLQHPSVNRGIWFRLENMSRTWAGREGSVAVVCGPVFDSSSSSTSSAKNATTSAQPERQHTSSVPVPTHFFMAVQSMASYESLAVLVSNDAKSVAQCMSVGELEVALTELSKNSSSKRACGEKHQHRRCKFFKHFKLSTRVAIVCRSLAFGEPNAHFRHRFEQAIRNHNRNAAARGKKSCKTKK